MATTGHNGQLKAIVERIERLDSEIKNLTDDKNEIFAEAKSNGFDVPALRQVIKERAQDPKKREAKESLVDTYRAALGMTPIERAIADRQDTEVRHAV